MFNRILSFLSIQSGSRKVAKERLQLILIQDRLNIYILEGLRTELIKLLSKYFGINDKELKIELIQKDEKISLITNVPINSNW